MLKEKSRDKKFWLPLIAGAAVVFLVGAMVMGIMIVGVITGGSSSTTEACTPGGPGFPGAVPDPGLRPPEEFRQEQISNAKIIDQTAAELGLSGTASKIAIIAAMGESTLINLGHGDEGQGVLNPDGSPTTSKGLFQQQTPGWGTVEQVMDPKYATTSFLLGANHKGTTQGLITVPNWESAEITLTIHEVQRNDNPNHYAASYVTAATVIKEASIDVDRPADETKQGDWRTGDGPTTPADGGAAQVPGPGGCAPGGGGAGAGVPGKSTTEGNTYPWDHLAPPPSVYHVDPMNFYYGECTSYSSWKVNEAMGGTAENIIFDNHYGGHQKGNGGQWKAAWEASGWTVSNVPKVDSVAYWAPFGGDGIGSAGHVGWVDEVTPDGKVIISEYNNSYYGPPGHEYSRRMTAIDPGEVNAYLYVPESK